MVKKKKQSNAVLPIREACLSVLFPGEEISGSEASGSEEMDEGEDEAADGGERCRKRRGWILVMHVVLVGSDLKIR